LKITADQLLTIVVVALIVVSFVVIGVAARMSATIDRLTRRAASLEDQRQRAQQDASHYRQQWANALYAGGPEKRAAGTPSDTPRNSSIRDGADNTQPMPPAAAHRAGR